MLPLTFASSEQTQAIGTVLLDLAWRATFEPVEAACDSMVVAPLPQTWTSVAVPRIALALRCVQARLPRPLRVAPLRHSLPSRPLPCLLARPSLVRVLAACSDVNGLSAGVAANAVVFARLVTQPSPHRAGTATPPSASSSDAFDWDRPWCRNGGCGRPSTVACQTAARLRGRVVVAADKENARAGVVVFEELSIEVDPRAASLGGDGDGGGGAGGARELCSGDYELRLTLHDHDGGFAIDGGDGDGGDGDGGDGDASSLAREEALPAARLTTHVNVRLVRSLNYSDVVTSHWAVELPGYFNLTDMTRTSSSVHYAQTSELHSIATTVVTNTTTVRFEWESGGTPTNSTNSSDAPPNVPFYGLPYGEARRPVWPAEGSEPVVLSEKTVQVRPSAHLLSFLRPPPSEPILLKAPFKVSLRLTTETGFSLPGEQVQAILLAPIGSGAVLSPGSYGYTDESGVATFNVTVEAGVRGEYLLLFGSAGTVQVQPRRDVSAVLGALQGALGRWREVVEPVAGSVAAVSTAVLNGQLHAILRDRIEAAVRGELDGVVEDVESCLSLLNYTLSQYDREQRIQARPPPPPPS